MKQMILFACLLVSTSVLADDFVCQQLAEDLADAAFKVTYKDQSNIEPKVTPVTAGRPSTYEINYLAGQPDSPEWGVGYSVSVDVNDATGDCGLETMSSQLLAE